MHIHAHLTNPNIASLYAAEAAEKAAAARQAAEVRKKLLQRASKLSSQMQIRQFNGNDPDSQQGQEPASDQEKNLTGQKKRTADDKQSRNPISMWA